MRLGESSVQPLRPKNIELKLFLWPWQSASSTILPI